VLAWTIAFVLAAHLGAVVWHAAIKRDTILTRMWPGYRPAAPIAKS
jgi:cytochrome b561